MKRIHAGAAVSLSVLWLLTGCAGGAARSGATGQPSTPVSDYRPVETIVTGTSRTRAKAHTDLGLAYLEAGNVAVALDEGRKALGDDSSYASAHNLMASPPAWSPAAVRLPRPRCMPRRPARLRTPLCAPSRPTTCRLRK